MRILKLITLFFIFNFSATILSAQPFIDLAGYHYQQSFSSGSKPEEEIQTKSNNVFFNIPVKIDSDYVSINPAYENLFVKIKETTFTLHSVAIPVSWLHQWENQKWKTAFVFIPRMMSDNENSFQGNSYQWGGAVLMIYNPKPNLKYKLGVYYNSEFFGSFVLPLVGIDWNVDDRLNIYGILPGSMNLEYKLRPNKIHIGFSFRSITNSCRWKDDRFIKINDNHIKALVDFYFYRKHVFSLEAGHSVGRKYRNGIRVEGKNRFIDFEVKNGFLFKAGYSFRFRTD